MRAGLMVAVLAMAMLAGCTGDDGPKGPITGKEAVALTEAKAQQRDDSARLFALTSIEIGTDVADDEPKSTSDLMQGKGTRDDSPGDGESTYWIVQYMGDDGILVYIIKNGAISQSRQVDWDEAGEDARSEIEPIGEWTLDSDNVTARAAAEEPDFADIQGDTHGVVLMVLQAGKEEPVWLVIGYPADDSDESVQLGVGARSGEVLDILEALGIDLPGIQESGGDSSIVAAGLVGTTEFSFELGLDSHEALAVHVSATPPQVLPLHVIVTDPDGVESTFETSAAVNTITEGFVHIDEVPAGTYTVLVQYPVIDAGTLAFDYCTDGLPMGSLGIPNEACNYVASGGQADLVSVLVRDRLLALA